MDKKVKGRFTIVLAHYNQMKYIKTSIKSVLIQDYNDIELIIADDCSNYFDQKEVEKYVNQNKKANLHSFKILANKTNVGTVKNLNNAIDNITGEYVMFFAADDELNNKKVVTNFITAFKDKTINIVTSQSMMYDETLTKFQTEYVNVKQALENNKLSAKQQYSLVSQHCIYSSGSTAYRMAIFKKYGKFNEKYQLVEDWSYWLYLTRNGEKLYYFDFNTLNHREGGVSHNSYTPNNAPVHIRNYYVDILEIFSNEIMPFIDDFEKDDQLPIYTKFEEHINYYGDFIPDKRKKYENLCKALTTGNTPFAIHYNKIKNFLRIKALLKVHCYHKFLYVLVKNRVNLVTLILWLALSVIISYNKLLIGNNFVNYMFISLIVINYIVRCLEEKKVVYISTLLLTFIIVTFIIKITDYSSLSLLLITPIIFIVIYYILFIPFAAVRKKLKTLKGEKSTNED